MALWVVTLGGALALGLLLFGMWRALIWSVQAVVGRRHRQLQHVLETGRPAPGWVRRNRGDDVRRLRARCLRRLDALLAYAERSQLVADEQTRRELIRQLRDLREQWQRTDWRPDGAAPGRPEAASA